MPLRRVLTLGLTLTLAACAPVPATAPPAPAVAMPHPEPAADGIAQDQAPANDNSDNDSQPTTEPPPVSGRPILDAHNRFRARHCAPPLSWSDELAKEGQTWADSLSARGCAFDHNPNTRHGENLAYFMPVGSKSPEAIAEMWYREVQIYDFGAPGFSFEAGHFTQLVWRSTQRMGCGHATCQGGELWVCNYDPPGNVHKAFASQVLPTSCDAR